MRDEALQPTLRYQLAQPDLFVEHLDGFVLERFTGLAGKLQQKHHAELLADLLDYSHVMETVAAVIEDPVHLFQLVTQLQLAVYKWTVVNGYVL